MTRLIAVALLVLWGCPCLAAGPFGGSVTDLLLSPERGEPKWVTTDRGLFRNGGGRWHRVEALEQAHLTAVAHSADSLVVAEKYRGLQRSDDDGRTWGKPKQPPRGRSGHAPSDILCVVSGADGRLFAGTAGQGAFESRDGGVSWSLLAQGLEDAPPQAFHVTSLLPGAGPRPLLMGTDGMGLFAWEGGRWAPTGEGLPERLRVSALVASPRDPQRLALGSFAEGLWLSRDGGATWSQARKGRYRVVGAVSFASTGALAAHFPEDGLVVVAEGGAVSRPVSLRRSRVRVLAANASGGWFAGLEHDGVVELAASGDPGREWNQGLDATRVGAVAAGDAAGSLWCADANGVFFSANGGATWEPRNQGLAPSGGLQFLRHGGRLFLGTAGQGVWEWSPATGAWKGRSVGLGTANTIFSLTADAGGERLYVGTEGGILRRDGEDPWVRVEFGLPGAAPRLVSASPSVPGLLWAASPLVLARSADYGESWTELLAARAVSLAAERSPSGDRLWLLEPDGLRSFHADGEVAYPAGVESGEEFTSVFPSADGVWAGSSRGLWLLEGDALRRVWAGGGVNAALPVGPKVVVGSDGRGVLTFRVR